MPVTRLLLRLQLCCCGSCCSDSSSSSSCFRFYSCCSYSYSSCSSSAAHVSAATPLPPPLARHARICKGNAFRLQFVFTTCLALCSFYGICWRCFALISFHCPRSCAPTQPVTLCPLNRGGGKGTNARYQSRKSVHEANQQTQLLLLWFLCCLPCSTASPVPLLLSPPSPSLVLFIFHSCFRLHALNQFAPVSSARHSSNSAT